MFINEFFDIGEYNWVYKKYSIAQTTANSLICMVKHINDAFALLILLLL